MMTTTSFLYSPWELQNTIKYQSRITDQINDIPPKLKWYFTHKEYASLLENQLLNVHAPIHACTESQIVAIMDVIQSAEIERSQKISILAPWLQPAVSNLRSESTNKMHDAFQTLFQHVHTQDTTLFFNTMDAIGLPPVDLLVRYRGVYTDLLFNEIQRQDAQLFHRILFDILNLPDPEPMLTHVLANLHMQNNDVLEMVKPFAHMVLHHCLAYETRTPHPYFSTQLLIAHEPHRQKERLIQTKPIQEGSFFPYALWKALDTPIHDVWKELLVMENQALMDPHHEPYKVVNLLKPAHVYDGLRRAIHDPEVFMMVIPLVLRQIHIEPHCLSGDDWKSTIEKYMATQNAWVIVHKLIQYTYPEVMWEDFQHDYRICQELSPEKDTLSWLRLYLQTRTPLPEDLVLSKNEEIVSYGLGDF